VFSGTKKPAPTSQAPTVHRLLIRNSRTANAGNNASRPHAASTAPGRAPRRASTAAAITSAAAAIGQAS
jgi:hypothetical protein